MRLLVGKDLKRNLAGSLRGDESQRGPATFVDRHAEAYKILFIDFRAQPIIEDQRLRCLHANDQPFVGDVQRGAGPSGPAAKARLACEVEVRYGR